MIREEWTTLTYTIQITEQREGLFKGTVSWVLPEEQGVKGEKVTGERSFKGEWTALGVFGWDNSTVEVVSFKSVQRHAGTLVDDNTIRFLYTRSVMMLGSAGWSANANDSSKWFALRPKRLVEGSAARSPALAKRAREAGSVDAALNKLQIWWA